MPGCSPRLGPTGRRRRHSWALASVAAALLGAPPAPAQEWVALGRPTTHDLNELSFVDTQRGWAAGDGGTILATTDGGDSWAPQSCPVAFDVVDIDMVDGTSGWALAQQFPGPPTWEYGTSVLRTTDGGASWLVQSTFADIFIHAIDFTDPLQGCMGGELGNLWWTNDGGVQWTIADVDSIEIARWPIRGLTFHTATYGMATGGLYDVTGLVWRTTDGGRSWTHERVAGEPVFGTHFFDSLNVICVGGDLDYGAGMVQTSSGGAQWQYTYLGLWGQAEAVAFRTPTEGWAPLGFAGTYMKTVDGGDRWVAAYTPDSTAMHDVVFVDSATGFMAGDGGTILRYVGGATSAALSELRHDTPLLLRTCPNPFSPRTRVDFHVPRPASVSLRIYDVRGREVTTLVDDRLGSGTHSRTLEGRGLPDGVYFGRLRVGEATETVKILRVR